MQNIEAKVLLNCKELVGLLEFLWYQWHAIKLVVYFDFECGDFAIAFEQVCPV